MTTYPCDSDGYCEAMADDNARDKIRVLEKRLAAESAKVGELQTQLDEYRSSEGITPLYRAMESIATIVLGENDLSGPWEDVVNKILKRIADERQEWERRNKELQAEIDRLREVLNDIHAATKELPDLGALLTAKKIEWAAAEIKKQRKELRTWRKWRPFLEAYSVWRFDRHFPEVPKTRGVLWKAIEANWEGEYNIPEAGGEPKTKIPDPDPCPLPATVEGWTRTGEDRLECKELLGEWTIVVYPSDLGSHYYYRVFRNNSAVASAPCRTHDGALKLGAAAARRAWRVGARAKL